MSEGKQKIKLRHCYDKDGRFLDKDTKLNEYTPLRELLEMFRSVHDADCTVPFDEAG